MRKLLALISCFVFIGCAEVQPIEEKDFFDQWWILSEADPALEEYKGTYCFYPDSNGEIVFQDVSFYYPEEIYQWKEIKINTYDIEDFAVVEVSENTETLDEDDWFLKKFPLSAEAVAVLCEEFYDL